VHAVGLALRTKFPKLSTNRATLKKLLDTKTATAWDPRTGAERPDTATSTIDPERWCCLCTLLLFDYFKKVYDNYKWHHGAVR